MKPIENPRLLWIIGLWMARGLALFMFLIWGAFFVEHLKEWFITPYPRTPPASVWIGQLLHLAMLVGLVVVLRWPIPGFVLLATSALVFFGMHAGSRFPWLFGITILPALLVVLCWWQLRSGLTAAIP